MKNALKFNEIYCEDCLKGMNKISDESIDLVITSPPYNLRNTTGFWSQSDSVKSRWPKAQIKRGYDGYDDNMPHDEYVLWQIECLKEMYRIIKPTGAIFYNHKWRVQAGLLQDRHDIVSGFPVRQIIIWAKNGGVNHNEHFFLPTYEVIYLIAKPDFRLLPGKNGIGDVWKIGRTRNNFHPAPFPEKLVQRIIDSTSAEVICDPFAGEGTTLRVAQKNGLKFIGFEISQKYVDFALKKLLDGKTLFSQL